VLLALPTVAPMQNGFCCPAIRLVNAACARAQRWLRSKRQTKLVGRLPNLRHC